ncbi:MAG: SDR family NAD(P)-dependent oxidoreductase [Candidatus Melainabacteria bacterium]|nr:MAG: SDR family NAD(P)-dependent oxidoreductase [Candidatus Melainabacteria bacterium]
MQLNGKKVLVTGGAGFIGSNLVDGLIEQGNKVVVLDDLSSGKESNIKQALDTGNCRFIKGSITENDAVKEALKDIDVVIHMAVQCLRLSFDKPFLVHEVNATGTLNVLKLAQDMCEARQKPLDRFVYVSSSEVYGTAITAPMTETHPLCPTTVYGASKLAGELYTDAFGKTYGMPVLVVRPFNTYGYREHHEGVHGEVIPRFLVRMLNNLAPVIYGDGSQTRDFTFVPDTVQGIIAATCAENLVGKAVNVARGQEVTIRKIAEMMIDILGKKEMKVVFEKERPADVSRHYADINLIKQMTGFEPKTSIEDGLKAYISWFQAQNHDLSGLLKDCALTNWNAADAKVLSTSPR